MNTENSILQQILLNLEKGKPVEISVKRDDLIDEVVSGNKWRKLKYHLEKAKQLGKTGILTFGGAYSNHLVATAKACQLLGYNAIGLVRGEELNSESNSTLKACVAYGMQLIFVTRNEYSDKDCKGYRTALGVRFPEFYVLPEGGKGYLGAMGCQEIIKETPNNYNHVYVAGGTGTTATGILMSANESTQVHLISSLKGNFLQKEVRKMLMEAFFDDEVVEDFMKNIEIVEDSTFGGYAKANPKLLDFINDVYRQTALKLEPIYTGKAFFHLLSDLNSGRISEFDKILFIHTGGLQGASLWKNELEYLKEV